jgi:hypothetical protein
MGGIISFLTGGGSKKQPALPPVEVKAPPQRSDAEIMNSQELERQKMRKGRAATLLSTVDDGNTGNVVSRKTLLGQ